jgi:hypothetical protein
MSSGESMSDFNVVQHGLAITELIILLVILYKIQNFDLRNKTLMKDVEEIENRITSIQDWIMFLFVISISHSVSILSLKIDNRTNALIFGASIPVLLTIVSYLYSSNLQLLSETVNSNLTLLVILQMVVLIGLHAVFYVVILPMVSRSSGQIVNEEIEEPQQSQLLSNGMLRLFPNVDNIPQSFGENINRYKGPVRGKTMSEAITDFFGGQNVSEKQIGPGLTKEFMMISQQDFNRLSWEQKINELFQDKMFAELKIHCDLIKQSIIKYESSEFDKYENVDTVFDKKTIRRKAVVLGQMLDQILMKMKQWLYNKKVSETFATFVVDIIAQLLGEIIMDEIQKIRNVSKEMEPLNLLINYIKTSPTTLRNYIHNMFMSDTNGKLDENIWILAISQIYTVFGFIIIVSEDEQYDFTKKSILDFETGIQKYMRENFLEDDMTTAKPQQSLFENEKTAKNDQELVNIQDKNYDILDQIYYLYENGFTSGIRQGYHQMMRKVSKGPGGLIRGVGQWLSSFSQPTPEK